MVVSNNKPSHSFPLVAIGASAGGLEAVTQLIRNLPSNIGMTFIYVQHLSPDYKSMLAALLSKSTRMKVKEATNGEAMKPNHFYIIPPNKEMCVTDGHIKLVPRKKDRLANLPINIFFTSLAKKHQEDVIGIILSGMGSDGTKGLKVIKQEGGLTFAQDGSAKFSSMPESAIAEGCVDFVMSPKEIAAALIQFSKSKFAKKKEILQTTKGEEIENKHPDLKFILQLLYKQKGMDFSHYKMNTIKRRIIRRVQMHRLKTLKQYAEFLKRKKEEVELLCQDLLINVTNFYRDEDAFSYLKTTLFPKILRNKTAGETLRLWVPACSTGEEVYSIALILLDLQSKKTNNIPIQIFATDLSLSAIRKARMGEYTEADLATVPPKLVQKYFNKSKDTYRVGKSLRESCVFAQHNILYDPAFSNVDFISCCNLLIYLDSTAQKKVIATFHYALKDNGYLMLSKSETIGTSGHLFSPINKKLKLYLRKKNTGIRNIPTITPRFPTRSTKQNASEIATHHLPATTYGHLGTAIDAVLLSRYMPTSVVINHDMEIIEVRGSTEMYLRMPAGKASLNVLKMARLELAYELRNAIHTSIKTKHTVRRTGIEMIMDNSIRVVSLEVAPLKVEGEEPLLLILFTEQQHIEIYDRKNTKNSVSAKDNRIKKLEEELASSRSDMLAAVHDHEATIEELQSANEEVVSNNEELRTLNEELETSKEEIESTNEELLSAYQKLQVHAEQVEKLNTYSDTIIATIHNPMLVLDKELNIKSANTPFYKHFHVYEKIEGRKLHSFNNKQWKIHTLLKLLEDVVSKKSYLHNYEFTHMFKDLGKKILLLNAQLTKKDNNEQLIVLVIEDITERANLRNKEQKLLEELKHANASLEDLNHELTSFNYVSSHDLQEPLRKIKTFINLILSEEQEGLSETAKIYFQRIQKSADKMQLLIQDLLAYSHMSFKERKFEKTDIAQVVAEIKKELEEEINEKNAFIETGALDQLNTIGFQFHQLMLNLIGNALKYASPKRKPHLFIKSKINKGKKLAYPELLPEITYCHLSVTDNGIGFNSKFKERIFKLFERLHDKGKYEGSGIGLAICKKIVKNHNGFISATSEEGKGTTFDIYIPVENISQN